MTSNQLWYYQFMKLILWSVVRPEGHKLVQHATKVVKWVFESKELDNRDVTCSLDGKGTTDTTSVIRQTQEKFGVKGKKLYF